MTQQSGAARAKSEKTPAAKRKRAISAISLAAEKMSQWIVDFNNEVFYRARIVRVSYFGRELFLVLRGDTPIDCGASVDLRVGDVAMRIGVESVSSCALLDERLRKMAFEIYPADVQKILVESLLDPLLSTLEGWLCAPATVENVALHRVHRRRSLPFHVSFHIYEKNPHCGESVPLVISGMLSMDRNLMERILDAVRAEEVVPYRYHEAAVPRTINAVAALEMPRNAVADLRVGDVILLENTNEIEMGIRNLIGLSPYCLRCRQNGDKMTVIGYLRH
ncbi:MAG: hypothetical protein LBI39_04635 [Puniceicoccales bacterium]|jgi:hypothetical protein|nr:hypothetical protein [Puniceicoccales bacterium]